MAAEKAADLAQRAFSKGTFGIGGFLMDRSGRLIAEACNAVVQNGEVVDPTAHVERQLIDWYFQSGLAASMPAGDLVLVSSVDPCAMCAGAILASGIRVIALAEDRVSGIHDHGKPARMPSELRSLAERSIKLFSVDGVRDINNPNFTDFSDAVSPECLASADDSFLHSLDKTRRLVGGVPSGLPDENGHFHLTGEILNRLRELNQKLPDTAWVPDDVLCAGNIDQMVPFFNRFPEDTCVLAGPDMNVILAAAGRRDVSPGRASILELARAYILLKKAAREHIGMALPNQRRCSVVKLNETEDPALALLELGALGSFFEEACLQSTVPSYCYIHPSGNDLMKRWLHEMPPFYTKMIGLSVGCLNADFL